MKAWVSAEGWVSVVMSGVGEVGELPPGDTPTRRSAFDSLLAGCIPVFFEELSAKKQYVWHFPEDEHDEFSIMIPKKDVVFMLGRMYVVTRNARPLETDCIPSHEKKKKMKEKKKVNECIQLKLSLSAGLEGIFWSIMKTHNTEGQIWTTKLTDGTGSFETAKVQSFDHSLEKYGWKYEYTQLEKVKRVCPKKKLVGDKYQYGYDAFDMLVKHKNLDSTGSAVPIFVGDHVYNRHHILNQSFSPWKAIVPPVSSVTSFDSRQNISFEISFRLNFSSNSRSGISSLSLSLSDNDKVKISAEGFYDNETGEICMVGCRNINSNNTSFDCEIAVKFHLPQGNGSFLKGSIESLREKQDVLYFEHLDIFSLTYTETEARKMIWRIDLEIIMVLISDTLVCVFIGQQLFHLKKTPEMISSISVFTIMEICYFDSHEEYRKYFEMRLTQRRKIYSAQLLRSKKRPPKHCCKKMITANTTPPQTMTMSQ
nr:hypothetical protein CTI12_AA330670 [Tanacetum cinerariifolium]